MVGMRGEPCEHLYICYNIKTGLEYHSCHAPYSRGVTGEDCIVGKWCPIKGDPKYHIVGKICQVCGAKEPEGEE